MNTTSPAHVCWTYGRSTVCGGCGKDTRSVNVAEDTRCQHEEKGISQRRECFRRCIRQQGHDHNHVFGKWSLR